MSPCRHRIRLECLAARLTAACVPGLLLCSALAIAQQDFGQQPTYPPPAQNAPAYQDHTPPPAQDPAQTAYPSTPTQPLGYGNGSGMPPAPAQGDPLRQLVQSELQDHGVPPQRELQRNLHGPTPTSIPGGQLITTDRVIALLQGGAQSATRPLVFHVLGQGDRLPGAENAAPASQAGTFDDRTQQEFGQYLQQVTQGDKNRPMLFYCLNTQCWMSYNAALRAINMGYANVLWYRGGIEAWQQAQQMATAMRPQGQRAPGGYP